MSSETRQEPPSELITKRTHARFARYRKRIVTETDRLFTKFFAAQWACAILVALVYSPYGWEGKTRSVNMHVWIAVFFGGFIASLPIALTWKKSGTVLTRYVVAVAQMLFSALFIHLTGGRIETHFHVFVSLIALAFYLDWGVMVVAAVTVAADHFVRGLLWPESVYGVVNPEWWLFLLHAFWVVLAVVLLGWSCRKVMNGWLAAAVDAGLIEAMAEGDRQSALERQPEKVQGG